MPVNFKCAKNEIVTMCDKNFKSFRNKINEDLKNLPSKKLLRIGAEDKYFIGRQLISQKDTNNNWFSDESKKLENSEEIVIDFNRCNGLVFGAIEAYNKHHIMTFDPTKVWLTILAQYNFFHERFAEDLRELFVNHEGKKELVVTISGNIQTFDANEMLDLFSLAIDGNIKKGDFTNWVTPNFTTTQPIDIFTSKAMLMSVLQKYFDFKCQLMCGIPEYNILGEKDDWLKIIEKLDYFHQIDICLTSRNVKGYGGELTMWYPMLKEVLREFVNVFDNNPNLEFWNTICHHISGGSGPSYLSGWISVFNCFDNEGKYLGDKKSDVYRGIKNNKWPLIDTNDLQNAITSVPVIINDNFHTEYNCSLFAGVFGFNTNDKSNTVIPQSNYVLISNEIKSID